MKKERMRKEKSRFFDASRIILSTLLPLLLRPCHIINIYTYYIKEELK